MIYRLGGSTRPSNILDISVVGAHPAPCCVSVVPPVLGPTVVVHHADQIVFSSARATDAA